MKKFYLFNGSEQEGPFDLEALESKKISKETPIWKDFPNGLRPVKLKNLKVFFSPARRPSLKSRLLLPKNPFLFKEMNLAKTRIKVLPVKEY